MDPINFFKHPKTAGQKQYEALRAFYIEGVPGKEVIRRYGYKYAAFNSLKQRFKSEQLQFFMTPSPGRPKGTQVSPELIQKIIDYRRKNLSGYQIAEVLDTLGTPVHLRTIFRILAKEGFPKLPRRTHLKIGLTKNNTIVPAYASTLDTDTLSGWKGECSIGGIFLFAPLIQHFDIPSIIKKARLPHSPKISAINYVLSMLALKLVGKERLSRIGDFNQDRGLGLFADLNILPKSTAVSTYSYRLSQKMVNHFMKCFVEKQHKLKTYGSDTINVDFHTIQHYGDESVLEEHWAGARSKRVKGALTLIAQDCDSRCQLYVQTDILKRDADDQILEFVKFWKKIRGKFRQTLVFDSKLTSYKNLSVLDNDGIKFITLRRRGQKMIDEALSIPNSEWKRVKIDAPKRKYKNPLVHDSFIDLDGYGIIRQLIMRGNGREKPAFFVTNDFKTDTADLVQKYPKRWRIENSIEEAISFFNLNALSSPILIKIHFDVVLTMIADTLYYYLAQSLRGFENCDAEKIFRHFIDMPANIEVKGQDIFIQYPLRAHSPVLRSAGLDKWIPNISWLGDRKLHFRWGN
jgi:transposase